MFPAIAFVKLLQYILEIKENQVFVFETKGLLDFAEKVVTKQELIEVK